MTRTDTPGIFVRRIVPAVLALLPWGWVAMSRAADRPPETDGLVVKAALDPLESGENRLKPDAWQPWAKGFDRTADGRFICDNGDDARVERGAWQTVVLDQERPEPIIASAWSRAEGATGTADPDYSVYVDLIYADGTPLWGQSAPFPTGTTVGRRAEVVIVPEKPVRLLTVNLLFRRHGGRAEFRDPELRVLRVPAGGHVFDGVPVALRSEPVEGFQVRDVAAGGDFVAIAREAAGLRLESTATEQGSATFFDVTLRDTTGRDRAVTLLYSIPVKPEGGRWLEDPRRSADTEPGREYIKATTFLVGSSGRLSQYPFGAVVPGDGPLGMALGIDPAAPAFYRVAYHAGTGEFFLAFDLGLTPERPEAKLRFVRYGFDPAWGFRAALAEYYRLFPAAFERRVTEQGLWMPFARISRVPDWGDFGFRFKEGNDETRWDDERNILTFRYTEPLTWWMPMRKVGPRTPETALAEARRLAEGGKPEAKALFTSGYHDSEGRPALRLMDMPWNSGAVWSMNSMPGLPGDFTDFSVKWNPKLRDELYKDGVKGTLDGEYVDSSEGYVTDELDFRRDHFAHAGTPLTFSQDTHQPAIFRGLIAYEYVRGIATDIHGMRKLMMANSTPDRLSWLAPMLDVMGTETDWNPGGNWRPMPDAHLLYRRAMCKGKPFCFLMNTDFDRLPPDRVESYMKRSLAYGMFPGFFSHNASDAAYFTRPALFERDRPLFRKYVPLCKQVAEAGWEPITGARSSDDRIYVERFGGDDGACYLTVFNDGRERRTATITLEGPDPEAPSRELVAGGTVRWSGRRAELTLDGEDVAVIELRP